MGGLGGYGDRSGERCCKNEFVHKQEIPLFWLLIPLEDALNRCATRRPGRAMPPVLSLTGGQPGAFHRKIGPRSRLSLTSTPSSCFAYPGYSTSSRYLPLLPGSLSILKSP